MEKIMMTKYICLEGGEGTYKTTTSKLLASTLYGMGFTVLETKEPGTGHLPLTIKLRELMLSLDYSSQLTPLARELISQSIRSIHLDQLITPAIAEDKYDFIIQDRGILSGRIYAKACGHDISDILALEKQTTKSFFQATERQQVYDHVFIFRHKAKSVEDALQSAKDKAEFASGDAMENMGTDFHTFVNNAYDHKYYCKNGLTKKLDSIVVDGKSTEDLVNMILALSIDW